MYKTLIVARREYNSAVRTKAFLISAFLLPLLMGGGAIAQYVIKDQVDITEKRFAIVDRTEGEQLASTLEAAAQRRNTEQIVDPATGRQSKPAFTIERVAASAPDTRSIASQRFELSQRVRKGELFGFLEVGARVLELPPDQANGDGSVVAEIARADPFLVRYQSNSPTYDDFHRWAHHIIEQTVHDVRLERAAFPVMSVRSALKPVPLEFKGLSKKDAETGEIAEARDENSAISMLAPAVLMILMFVLILVGGTPAMQGVVEEKMQRIAEMMLGSVRPFELMMGKLVGLTGVSLTLSIIYLGGVYWVAQHYGVAELISPGLIAWFLVYLVVAIVMYGSLFIAVGAACSDLRDTQTMLWPVMLVAMLPLFVWVNVAKEPSSTFATVISFIPFATPTLMIIRVAIPPGVAPWQPAIGLVLMLITTVLCVYIAGRIFRVGILMQGKGASLRDLARWVVRG